MCQEGVGFCAASLLTSRFILIELSACQDRIDQGFELSERGRADHFLTVESEARRAALKGGVCKDSFHTGRRVL